MFWVGGGGVQQKVPILLIIWETKRRIEMGEAVMESCRRDAPNQCLTFQNYDHLLGQGQVKGQNTVFSCLGP